MTRMLLLPLALTLALIAAPAGAVPAPPNATFVDATGVYHAGVVLAGACNGSATITITIHRVAGDEVHTVDVESAAFPEVCGGGLSCFECPPVPFPFTWTLEGPGLHLVGGGAAYYDHYSNHVLAWSLQGTFMKGVLEVRGVLG